MGQQLYQELDDMRVSETYEIAKAFGVLSEDRTSSRFAGFYHYNGWSFGTKTPSGRQVLVHEFEHRYNGRRLTLEEQVNSARIKNAYMEARK